MTEREKALRQGYVETHRKFDRDGRLYFYWEPYTDEKTNTFTNGFTIDHGSKRWRYQQFENAVKFLEEYERELDIAAALKALNIGELQ